MSRRIFGEMVLMLGVSGGAALGFSAGHDSTTQMLYAFLGMGLCGAFVDLCLKGGQ